MGGEGLGNWVVGWAGGWGVRLGSWVVGSARLLYYTGHRGQPDDVTAIAGCSRTGHKGQPDGAMAVAGCSRSSHRGQEERHA